MPVHAMNTAVVSRKVDRDAGVGHGLGVATRESLQESAAAEAAITPYERQPDLTVAGESALAAVLRQPCDRPLPRARQLDVEASRLQDRADPPRRMQPSAKRHAAHIDIPRAARGAGAGPRQPARSHARRPHPRRRRTARDRSHGREAAAPRRASDRAQDGNRDGRGSTARRSPSRARPGPHPGRRAPSATRTLRAASLRPAGHLRGHASTTNRLAPGSPVDLRIPTATTRLRYTTTRPARKPTARPPAASGVPSRTMAPEKPSGTGPEIRPSEERGARTSEIKRQQPVRRSPRDRDRLRPRRRRGRRCGEQGFRAREGYQAAKGSCPLAANPHTHAPRRQRSTSRRYAGTRAAVNARAAGITAASGSRPELIAGAVADVRVTTRVFALGSAHSSCGCGRARAIRRRAAPRPRRPRHSRRPARP